MATESVTRVILVVVEDAHLQQGLSEILELEGYEVVTVGNGLAALNFLEDSVLLADLIISDIRMTEMSGYELLVAVRAAAPWSRIPFVFLSDGNETGVLEYGLQGLPAVTYIAKPFDVRDLLAVVQGGLSAACAA
jgi:CheY-like chemotaxis protein